MSRMPFIRRCLLLLCLPTVLAAQNGPTVKLEDFKLTQVLRGDPQLLSELKGKVVVVKMLNLTAVTVRNMGHLTAARATRQTIAKEQYREKQQVEKNMLAAKQFAREFNRLHLRYEDSASVRCIGFLGQWAPTDDYFKAKPMTPEIAEDHAKAIGFKAPILKSEMSSEVPVEATQDSVMVFNAAGDLIYNGPGDSKADKAVRDALKELAP